MPVTVCPHCGVDVDLNAEDGGEPVECPACHSVFTAPLPIARPVKRLRHRMRSSRNYYDSAEYLIHHAKSECNVPASGLIAIGALSVFNGLGTAVGGGLAGKPAFGIPANWMPALYLGYGLYMAAAGAFQIYAGRQMRGAKQYGLCLIACITAVIPGVSPCVIGFVFGIMGLIKLRDPWVKKGFAANRPGFDPDTAT